MGESLLDTTNIKRIIMTNDRIPARFLATNEDGKDVWIINIYAATEAELAADGFMDFDDVEDIGEEDKWIGEMLEDATEYGLQNEVVQFALKSMKDDPRLTPAMAMRYGYLEWVK